MSDTLLKGGVRDYLTGVYIKYKDVSYELHKSLCAIPAVAAEF